jgi:hypothetical protein
MKTFPSGELALPRWGRKQIVFRSRKTRILFCLGKKQILFSFGNVVFGSRMGAEFATGESEKVA